MKKFFLGILIGTIITGGVSAVTFYHAKDIEFKSNNTEFEATNVEDAINDIYNMEFNLVHQGNATENDISLGKTAVVNGQIVIGTHNITKILLGSVNSKHTTGYTKTYDIKSIYPNYEDLTIDNFITDITNIQHYPCSSGWTDNVSHTLSYNSTTGILSTTCGGAVINGCYYYALNCTYYLLY